MTFPRSTTLPGSVFLTIAALLLALHPAAHGATKKKRKPSRKPSISKPAITAMDAREASKRQPGEPGEMPKKFNLLEPGELPIKAPGAIVIDGFSGETLYAKDADTPLFPASTTKALTALLVIEAGNLEQEVTVTEEDARVGESSLSIKPGDRYTRRQMLYGLMLKSANDVAHALARDNAGSEAAFAAKMTLRARELGATNSNFKNPHGLHHVEHYTTPHDLAVIARCAMQQPLFRKIVSTRKFSWERYAAPAAAPAKGPEIWHLSNHNRLLTKFEGCTGVKTGYTNPARHTLISAALREGREVIAAVMKDGKYEKWEDSMLLLTHGLKNPPKGAE